MVCNQVSIWFKGRVKKEVFLSYVRNAPVKKPEAQALEYCFYYKRLLTGTIVTQFRLWMENAKLAMESPRLWAF